MAYQKNKRKLSNILKVTMPYWSIKLHYLYIDIYIYITPSVPTNKIHSMLSGLRSKFMNQIVHITVYEPNCQKWQLKFTIDSHSLQCTSKEKFCAHFGLCIQY